MAELERLYVRVLGDIQDLEKKMATAEQRVFRFGGQMRAVGKGMTLGLTAPLVALGGVATAAAADLDRLRRGLDVSAGSAADAARQFADLERIAQMPGLGFREAIQGAVQLNTALEGMPNRLRLSSRLLEQFGNAIALTGGGRAELDRVIMQLGQMAASGRVLTADLRPIIQTAPAVATALRQAFGTIDAQEIERLGLSSQEFFERLLRGLESLPRAAAGPANALENFTDAAFRARAAAGRALLPAVADLTNQFADMLEQVDELDPRMVRLGVSLGAALAVAGPLTVAIGGLTTALVALKVAGVSLTLALGGPGALIAGLSLLVGWWVKNKLEAAAFREELDKIRQSAASAAVSLTPEDTLRVLGGRRQALANLQARRAEIIAERRAQLARIGPSGGGADLSDEAIIRGLGGRAREEFQAIERAIASTTGAIAALEAHYIAASKAAEDLGTKAAASMPALDLTLDTFQRLREAEARAMEELEEITIERVLAAGTEEAERLNEQFRETERWLAAIRAQLARFPSDASVLTPQAGMVQSIRPGLPTPSTAPVQAVGGWGLQWAVDTLSEALRRGQWIEDLPKDIQRAIREAAQGTALEAVLPAERRGIGLGDIGAALTGIGGIAGGRAGGFLGGIGGALTSIVSATNPVTMALGAFGGAVTALTSILDDGVARTERMRAAFDSLLSYLDARFNLLDTPVVEQFEELRDTLLEKMTGGPLRDLLARSDLGSIQEFINATLREIDRIKAIEDPMRRMQEAMKLMIQFGGLSQEQIIEMLQKFKALASETNRSIGEALRNVPTGFKVALARFRVTEPVVGGGRPTPGGPFAQLPVPGGPHSERPVAPVTMGDVTIVVEGTTDPRETARRVMEEFERMVSRGGGMALRPVFQAV